MVIEAPRPNVDPLPLSTLLPGVDPEIGAVLVSGVAMDSRRVHVGDIYLAVPGANVHGARFVPAAVQAGAAAVVTDAAGAVLAADAGVPVVVVADPRAMAGTLAADVYGRPSTRMTVIGITGTNGKTTMSHLIESVLAAAGLVTGMIGTTGHLAAGKRIPTEHTTPEAPEVQALLGHMADAGVQAVVMEVSSHALAFGRVTGVDFDVAVFTNLTQDHLDFHGTMADYFDAKSKLFTMAPRQVVCVDDEWGRRLVAGLPDAVTYAVTTAPADWRAEDVTADAEGSRFTALGPAGLTGVAQVGLPGLFNVANALGALAVATEVGIPLVTALAGVGACPGVPGRMQRVSVPTLAGGPVGPRAYVDYAHTPDAVARAIGAAGGDAVVVLGCGGDRDHGKRPIMGEVAARLARILVVTDDNPRSEDPAAIRAAMIEGAAAVPVAERAEVIEVPDRRAAIEAAVARSRSDDVLLVLGKGHEQGQYVGGQVLPFDDAQVLAEALTGWAQ